MVIGWFLPAAESIPGDHITGVGSGGRRSPPSARPLHGWHHLAAGHRSLQAEPLVDIDIPVVRGDGLRVNRGVDNSDALGIRPEVR
jgi:hypothetical protein